MSGSSYRRDACG